MSDDDSDSSEEEKGSYGFVGRLLLFLFIAGPGSVLGFGLWLRIGVGNSAASGGGGNDTFSMFIVTMWILGLISTGVMIFKK